MLEGEIPEMYRSVDEEEINRNFGGSLPAVHAVVKSYLQITWVTKWTE